MRATLDMDEDVLRAAHEIAGREGVSIGHVLSRLARESLARVEEPETRNGVPLFPRQPAGRGVTPELVNELRDETG